MTKANVFLGGATGSVSGGADAGGWAGGVGCGVGPGVCGGACAGVAGTWGDCACAEENVGAAAIIQTQKNKIDLPGTPTRIPESRAT